MQFRNLLPSLRRRLSWLGLADDGEVDAVQHFIDRGLRPSNACACPNCYPLEENDTDAALARSRAEAMVRVAAKQAEESRKWDELHQRVVDELRRELYHLILPGHLQAFKDSGLFIHADIYDRGIERWESDVEWAADELGADRQEFRRVCLIVDKLRETPYEKFLRTGEIG